MDLFAGGTSPRRSGGSSISRRQFVGMVTAAAGASLLGPAQLGWGRAEASTGHITGIDLDVANLGGLSFPYPFFADWQDVLRQNKTLLDSLARSYGREVPREMWDPADFWFRYAPIPLFADAMSGKTAADATTNDIRSGLWVMHLVGYFGGVWFRKKLNEFTPAGGINTSSGATPQESDFADLITYLRKAVPAAFAVDPAVPVDFARWALRGNLPSHIPPGLNDLLSSLIGLYGYNVGYTDNILRPPRRAYPPPLNANGPSEFSPPWNSQQATPQGLFDAVFPDFSVTDPAIAPVPPDPAGFTPVWYLTGDEPALAVARQKFAAAAAQAGQAGSAWNDIVQGSATSGEAPLPVLQAGAYNVGNGMWSVPLFLDVTQWDAPSYAQIVAMSVYFVQAVQAAAMGCLAAAGKVDPTQDGAADARNAALAAALVQPFGGSYLVGLNAASSPAYAARTSGQSIPPFTMR